MNDPRNHIKKSAYFLDYDVIGYSSNYEESESASDGGSSYFDEFSNIDFEESVGYTDELNRKGSKDSAGRAYGRGERKEKNLKTRDEKERDTQRSMKKFVKKRNKKLKYGAR